MTCCVRNEGVPDLVLDGLQGKGRSHKQKQHRLSVARAVRWIFLFLLKTFNSFTTMQLQYYSAIIEDILEKQKQISSLESILIKLKVGKQDQLIAQYCLIMEINHGYQIHPDVGQKCLTDDKI